MTLPDLPDPAAPERKIPKVERPIAFAALLGGGACLLAAVIGMIMLGLEHQGVNEVATTGLAAIGSTLAGGFAAWIGGRRGRE